MKESKKLNNYQLCVHKILSKLENVIKKIRPFQNKQIF